MKKRSYLVTGGTGFLGAALVRRLIEEGHRVRVLDDGSRGRARRLADLKGRFESISGDVRDRATVMKAARGVDSICHLAFINGTEFFYSMPEKVLEVGVKGMMNVIDACLERRIPELLVVSSSEVYQTPPRIPTDETAPLSIPDPLNPRYSYAGGKILSELLALNYGRKHIRRVLIVRPHNVYGPDMGREHVLPQLVRRLKALCRRDTGVVRLPIQGTGNETRAFIYIDDFIDGLMRVLRRGKHLNVYHIGTQEEVSIKKAAKLAGDYFGRRVHVVRGLKLSAGSVKRRCPDIGKLRRLGFEPRVPLKLGLPRLAAWYDKNR